MRCKGAWQTVNLVRERNPHWKGGRFVDDDGYVLVYQPDHKRAAQNGYVFEHILAAEQSTGRAIERPLQVHHLNGIRNDNRPSNLVVVLPKDHPRNTVRAALQERVRLLEAELERHGLPIP